MPETTEQTAPHGEGENLTAPIKIGDRELDPATALELISKGEDYTQKTQELARQRQEVEAQLTRANHLAEFQKRWDSDPAQRAAIVADLARQAGLDLGSVNQPATPTDWEDMTPSQQEMWRENQRLKQQVGLLGSTMNEIKGFIGKQAERDQIRAQTLDAKKAIRDSFGIEASAEDIEAAVIQSGIRNPEAAWLYANKQTVAKAMLEKGVGLQVGEKPNTPGNVNKTFDPYDPTLDADDVAYMMQQGYTPKPSR